MPIVSSPPARRPPWRGPLYLDASALVKLLFPEAGSAEIDRALRGRRDVLLSDLALTETVSSLARRRREGDLTAAHLAAAQATVFDLIASGALRQVELSSPDHREAERLLSTLASPLRAADALHLALSLSSEAPTLVTFDSRLAAGAREIGLVPVPQLEPRIPR